MRGGGREGRRTLSLPECQAARHVFFAVDRGDGDDENDKLFKAAAAPVADKVSNDFQELNNGAAFSPTEGRLFSLEGRSGPSRLAFILPLHR